MIPKEFWDLFWLVLPFAGSMAVAFCDATVKTFQARNIALGQESMAFYTSILVSSMNIAHVKFVIMGGWWVLAPIAIGGSCGVVVAMRIHKYIFRLKQI